MKGIELEIILDKPEKTYSYGEKIKGGVKAIVHEEWQCDALELFLGVKGFSEVKEGGKKFKLTVMDDREKKILYQGQWSPDLYTYPFEIDVPSGPFTYKGHLIDLSWYLKAEARPAKGESVLSEAELAVVPGKGIPEDGIQKNSVEVVHKESPKGSMGCLVVSLVFFLAGVLAAAKTFQSENDKLLGFAVFLALLGLAFILLNIYSFMVSKRIRMAEARIGSRIVSPGDIVPCSLSFQVNMPVEIKGTSVTLTCREEAGNLGIHASKTTYRKVLLYEKRHELQLPVKKVPANVPIQAQGEISLPPDASLSFKLLNTFGDGIGLKWNVEFRIEMKMWPDWFYTEEITVRPRGPS